MQSALIAFWKLSKSSCDRRPSRVGGMPRSVFITRAACGPSMTSTHTHTQNSPVAYIQSSVGSSNVLQGRSITPKLKHKEIIQNLSDLGGWSQLIDCFEKWEQVVPTCRSWHSGGHAAVFVWLCQESVILSRTSQGAGSASSLRTSWRCRFWREAPLPPSRA